MTECPIKKAKLDAVRRALSIASVHSRYHTALKAIEGYISELELEPEKYAWRPISDISKAPELIEVRSKEVDAIRFIASKIDSGWSVEQPIEAIEYTMFSDDYEWRPLLPA